MNISVKKAVNLIDATLQLQKDRSVLPYFFIVGAGISAPEIPLSGGIIELCKEEVKQRNREYYNHCVEDMKKVENDPVKNYSGWIELAFPNSVDRSRFFRKVITGAKISSANLMLAHILYSRRIATTVFTTNFDDKLRQALELIGVTDMFVAENSMDNLVVSPQNHDIQVVHVHGTYNFYDCANLESEIKSVASQSNTVSSSRILAAFLSNQAPIIVGYSGWENDVIMTCLRERLQYPTPLTYYWVCYSRESFDALPEWLKNSKSVAFVIPEMDDLGCDDETAGIKFVDTKMNYANNKIDATSFFSLLISSFKLKIPEIFDNPFLYYSKRIDSILPKNEDVLHLRHWANRMKFFGESGSEFDELVKQMEQADIANDLYSATETLNKITHLSLSSADICFTCETLISGLLEKKSIYETFQEKLTFRIAALDFIEKNHEILLGAGLLAQCLDSLLISRWKKEDRTVYSSFLDRIITASSVDKSALAVQIRAMGLKSSVVEDEVDKINLLEGMIQIAKDNLDNAEIKYLYCVSLCDLAELQPEEKAIMYLNEVKDLVSKKSKILRMRLIKAQSKLLLSLTDNHLKQEWIENIIEYIDKKIDDVDYSDILEISFNMAHLDAIPKALEEKVCCSLQKVYDKYGKTTFGYCEYAYWMACITSTLMLLQNDLRMKSQCYETIKEIQTAIPDNCKKRLHIQDLTLIEYCKIPAVIVPDQLKIEEILQVKRIRPNDNELVRYAVYCAMECGDVYLYEKCSELNSEIYYNGLRNELSLAYTSYTSKDFGTAESKFAQLTECGISDIEMVARNNLAFMLRRRETKSTRHSFWDLILKVSDTNPMKHMNIALFCKSEGLTCDSRFLQALENLRTATEEDIKEINDCWNDIALVGEEEHMAAQEILTQVQMS